MRGEQVDPAAVVFSVDPDKVSAQFLQIIGTIPQGRDMDRDNGVVQ